MSKRRPLRSQIEKILWRLFLLVLHTRYRRSWNLRIRLKNTVVQMWTYFQRYLWSFSQSNRQCVCPKIIKIKETSLTPLDNLASVIHTSVNCERNQILMIDFLVYTVFTTEVLKLPLPADIKYRWMHDIMNCLKYIFFYITLHVDKIDLYHPYWICF